MKTGSSVARACLLALTLLLASNAPAGAGLLTVESGTLSLVGPLGTLSMPATPTSGVFTVGGGFVLSGGVFGYGTASAPRLAPPSYGIAGLTWFGGNDVILVSPAGSPGGGFGGNGFLTGVLAVNILDLYAVSIPLYVAGSPGAVVTVGGREGTGPTPFPFFAAYGAGWGTGPQVLTGVLSTTPNTAVVNTVTLSGSDARTANHAGSITLVSAFRVVTDAREFDSPEHPFWEMANFWVLTVNFVPEPSALLLLGGAAGLVALRGRALRR
jgi:hypothetical protein